MAVVPVVHRRDPRPAPRAATSAGGDGRGRSLWTTGTTAGMGVRGKGFSASVLEAPAVVAGLEWDPLIGFVSDAITGSVEELLATRTGLQTLREQWLSRRRFRANSAASRMIDILVDYPVTTARRMAERLDLSMPATLTGIGQLVEAGIMRERTGHRRNRIFAALEILALLNRPSRSEPGRLWGADASGS